MIELYLLRHADAGDPEAWTRPDAERPLSEKGEKQADRLGRFLAAIGFAPDVIISSPKVRAAQTADIVAGHLGITIGFDDRLASAFDVDDVETMIHDAGDPARLVIAGHDPDFSDLLGELCGLSNALMKKGAFARIDIEDRPLRPGAGSLRWLVPPDLLKPAGR